jgi:hypothetical protein
MRRGVDRLTLTTVTENYVDMLLPDGPGVTRAGLVHHFDPKCELAVTLAQNAEELWYSDYSTQVVRDQVAKIVRYCLGTGNHVND